MFSVLSTVCQNPISTITLGIECVCYEADFLKKTYSDLKLVFGQIKDPVVELVYANKELCKKVQTDFKTITNDAKIAQNNVYGETDNKDPTVIATELGFIAADTFFSLNVLILDSVCTGAQCVSNTAIVIVPFINNFKEKTNISVAKLAEDRNEIVSKYKAICEGQNVLDLSAESITIEAIVVTNFNILEYCPNHVIQ